MARVRAHRATCREDVPRTLNTYGEDSHVNDTRRAHTQEVINIVEGIRLVDTNTVEQQAVIEQVAHHFSNGAVVIEDNSLGIALRENLNLPAERVHGFVTTQRSKPVA